ncbi:Protein of unknown function DUF2406 [Penicillium cf. griseofulvum]|uniref:DUF2406 domain-containing protein n=1 Tax=Penicillium cf. griseofulvum TaxID=2972120 RepID=A0A9W9N0D1_9EURO|nr:Protein of unknown function DUF2406 [Penicillium cf. griseofulvum]KAJ5421775.1 Protein of unknown function DUF2406 [Penicillium cf. griseofulvum]KAJ5427967.1 Protein of unknown function DUF2406 [Penicillium cf. griseofulvum]
MATPQSPTSPKRSRGFSVKSSNSDKSGSTSHRRGPSESSEEKARRNLHTKADPLVAMNELQPMAVALEQSNLGSLREIEHKDQYGNIITDPDLSNPTRPRLERPLDTIRSFEAAIYGTYSNNRASYARTEDAASQMGDFSRRTSYYGGMFFCQNTGPSHRNHEQGSHYGQPQSRPDSVVNAYQNTPLQPENPNPYAQSGYNQGGYNQNGYSQNSRKRPSHHPRGSPSAPITPAEGYQRSRDNVAAMPNTGYGNTNPYGQPTDPSSMNSSNDQLQQQALQQQRLDERSQAGYDFNSSSSPRAPQPVGDSSWGGPVGGPPTSTGAGPAQPPAVKNVNQPPASKEKTDKRKSWFKRRFSKD